MKIFVYKTLFVFACIFLIFHFTFGVKLRQIKGEIENYKSKENVENIKQAQKFQKTFLMKVNILLLLHVVYLLNKSL